LHSKHQTFLNNANFIPSDVNPKPLAVAKIPANVFDASVEGGKAMVLMLSAQNIN